MARRLEVRRRRQPESGRSRWLLSYADLITLLFGLFAVLAAVSLGQPPEAAAQGAPLARVVEAVPEAPPPEEPPPEDPLPGVLEAELRGLGAEVATVPGGVSVILAADPLLFRSGESRLQPRGRAVLRRLAGVAGRHGLALRVEGHTDDVPVRGGRLRSNWQLSAVRATAVVEHLAAVEGVPPERLSAAAFGEHRPRASNATDEGRRRNRRVEIVLTRPED